MSGRKTDERSGHLVSGHPATQSLKAAFRALIPDLPEGWKQQYYLANPNMNCASGATRLTKIRQGAVAPTTEELVIFNQIISDAKTQKNKASKRLLRQKLSVPKKVNN